MSEELAERSEAGGLRYIEVTELCITRVRKGRGFAYFDQTGARIEDERTREQIESIVIPPAWTRVCIAMDPDAHIQAVGRDAMGRLQYRYHPDWTAIRDNVKAERLIRFGRALPKIREAVERDLNRRRTDQRYAAAVATRLIDRALLRSGHSATTIDDGGRGATTLLKRDVRLNGTKVMLTFTGKGGKRIEKTVRDPILLRRLKKLKRIGKKRLFAFRDEDGRSSYLTARDLNAYLREISGAPVTAKDFRTFAASSDALAALAEAEAPKSERKRKILVAEIMKKTADRLANTPTVARSSYVHPLIVEAFEAEALTPALVRGPARQGLSAAETGLMRFLEEALKASTRASSRPAARKSPVRKTPARKAVRKSRELVA